MVNDFRNIDYLLRGNSAQKAAHNELTALRLFETFADFKPILTGTIPIEINIDSSDLDIVCEFKDIDHFVDYVKSQYGSMEGFGINMKEFYGIPSVVARFRGKYFDLEIFGQDVPSDQQNAYRHMLIEYRILEHFGPEFRVEIIKLKKSGYKTEPAFAKLLGIKGDPYLGLLRYDINVNNKLWIKS